ncbi:MAG TPA: hypothetical protein PKE04_20500 [Clostridia bacterium]|nr:hypothetical protein [Clostridia bacterium]
MNAAYTPEALAQAIKALRSSIGKCEKAREKLKESSPQRKWVDRQLKAYRAAVWLMENPADAGKQDAQWDSPQELRGCRETYALLIRRCEVLPAQFQESSPQRTLALRRLEAFRIATALIDERVEYLHGKETP